jgi:hypothetical protein
MSNPANLYKRSFVQQQFKAVTSANNERRYDPIENSSWANKLLKYYAAGQYYKRIRSAKTGLVTAGKLTASKIIQNLEDPKLNYVYLHNVSPNTYSLAGLTDYLAAIGQWGAGSEALIWYQDATGTHNLGSSPNFPAELARFIFNSMRSKGVSTENFDAFVNSTEPVEVNVVGELPPVPSVPAFASMVANLRGDNPQPLVHFLISTGLAAGGVNVSDYVRAYLATAILYGQGYTAEKLRNMPDLRAEILAESVGPASREDVATSKYDLFELLLLGSAIGSSDTQIGTFSGANAVALDNISEIGVYRLRPKFIELVQSAIDNLAAYGGVINDGTPRINISKFPIASDAKVTTYTDVNQQLRGKYVPVQSFQFYRRDPSTGVRYPGEEIGRNILTVPYGLLIVNKQSDNKAGQRVGGELAIETALIALGARTSNGGIAVTVADAEPMAKQHSEALIALGKKKKHGAAGGKHNGVLLTGQ